MPMLEVKDVWETVLQPYVGRRVQYATLDAPDALLYSGTLTTDPEYDNEVCIHDDATHAHTYLGLVSKIDFVCLYVDWVVGRSPAPRRAPHRLTLCVNR